MDAAEVVDSGYVVVATGQVTAASSPTQITSRKVRGVLVITNCSASNPVYTGKSDVATSTGDALGPSYQKEAIPLSDCSTLYVIGTGAETVSYKLLSG